MAVLTGPLRSRAAKAIGFIDMMIDYSSENAPLQKELSAGQCESLSATLMCFFRVWKSRNIENIWRLYPYPEICLRIWELCVRRKRRVWWSCYKFYMTKWVKYEAVTVKSGDIWYLLFAQANIILLKF